MATIQKISDVELKRILNLEEGAYLDLKRSEITPAKLSNHVSAFANTAGGELFVGIGETEKGKAHIWYGFNNAEAANPIFQVLEKMNPSGGLYKASFLECENCTGLVLHLTIFKTKDIVLATDGIPYVRRNASSLRVEGKDGLRRLELDKGIVSYEDNTVDVQLSTIANSSVVLSFILEIVPSAEPEAWLQKQNLVVGAKPTVAGIMLFSDEPQATLAKRSAIKVYRYKTKDKEGVRDQLVFDPITIEGCAYSLIKDAVAATKNIIEDITILAENGLERISYPDETLHEIITNAVLHRDYSIAADVHVRIFDNRVEVESPGLLPGHVTPENILREQSARNPKIVRLINKFPNPPNKDVGEGLNTAFEAMKKLRLKEPEVEERENSVVVHIRHAPLSSPHELIMGYVEEHGEIKNRIARELTGIGSENKIKNIFIELNSRKLLEPVPGKKGNASAWRKYSGHWEKIPPKDFFEYLESLDKGDA